MVRQSNPWDRPHPLPDSAVPDSTPGELYFAIGKALTEWSSIEHQLCMLFVCLFNGKHGYGSYKLYGALPSTAARMSALRIAAEALYAEKPEHSAYAIAVLGLVEKFIGRRNDIAHGLIALRREEGKATLMEPHYNIKHSRTSSGKECYEYEAHDILRCAEYFGQLDRELDHAWHLLGAPVRRGYGVRPSAETPLTVYVEPFRTDLARRLAGLKSRKQQKMTARNRSQRAR